MDTQRNPLEKIPDHLGIIMDGNGRWAKVRHLPRLAGHRAGVENVRPVLEGCAEFGVPMLTIWAFSTENWRRPKAEVQGWIKFLRERSDYWTKKQIALRIPSAAGPPEVKPEALIIK